VSWKAITLYFVGVLALVVVLIVASQPKRDITSSFKSTDENRPIVALGLTEADLGAMTLRDIKSSTFDIRNDGKADLELTRVNTSCDCTYAYVTIAGQKSERFIMHNTLPWVGKVAPNQSATLEVVYQPSIMPVRGPVERTVTVATNDPNKPVLTFTVKATVSE